MRFKSDILSHGFQGVFLQPGNLRLADAAIN